MSRIFVLAAFSLSAVACSHQVQFYGGVHDINADNEFQRAIERRDADVKKCYGHVIATDDVPLEMVVDENGRPLAARATGPIFGSTLAGCMETVAFKITLSPGNGRRIATAVAAMHPTAPAIITPPHYRRAGVPEPDSDHTTEPGDTMTPVSPQQTPQPAGS